LAIHESKKEAIRLAEDLIEVYNNNFRKTYPKTNLAVMITNPKECLKGFVSGVDYVDYSYWAPGLNYLFGQTKILPEGRVFYIKRDGKATMYKDGKATEYDLTNSS